MIFVVSFFIKISFTRIFMQVREKFNPMCFLSSLGAGGLSVSFFMYLMFLVPHEGTPMPTFNHIFPELIKGTWLSFVIAFSLVFIIAFAYIHFKLLIWNTKQFNIYKNSDEYKILLNSNSEINLMTIPLTFIVIAYVNGIVIKLISEFDDYSINICYDYKC